MKTSLFLVTCLAALSGCGSSGGSGGSGGVNSKITGKGARALNGQVAVFEASRGLAGAHKMAMMDNAAPESKPPGVQDKARSLTNSIHTTACKTEIQNKPVDSSGGGVPSGMTPVTMKISGASCPVEINFDISIVGADGKSPCQDDAGTKTCKFATLVKVTYRVVDQKLAEQLEVRSGHINITSDMEQVLPSKSDGSSGMNMAIKGKFSYDLKAVDLDDQAYLVSGSEDVNMKMETSNPRPGEPPNMQMYGGIRENLRYVQDSTGASSELRAVVTFSGTSASEKYVIDGSSVGRDEYQKEREKFANSMMNVDSSGGGGQPVPPNEDPAPGPVAPAPPAPVPHPGPGPVPPPSATPAPMPEPPVMPAPHSYICVIEDLNLGGGFIGYGSVEFVAKTNAQQACHDVNGDACSSYAKCEKQEVSSSAWFCKTKNVTTGKIFTGVGASKTEAGYITRKTCLESSSSSTSSCQKVYDGDCVHQ